MSGIAWLDDDGAHVWVAHECKEGLHTTMLPHPNWTADSSGAVHPSVHCDLCGWHESLGTEIVAQDQAWSQLARRRADSAFMERLRARIAEDKVILDRLRVHPDDPPPIDLPSAP